MYFEKLIFWYEARSGEQNVILLTPLKDILNGSLLFDVYNFYNFVDFVA